MAITSNNALLNQFVPDFCIKTPVKGEALIYDNVTKSFKNKIITAEDIGLTPPAGLLWENTYQPGDVVTISDTLLTFKAVPKSDLGGGAERLGDLLDVDLTGLTLGQTIVWNGTSFVPGESGVKSFIELDDVPNGYASAGGKVVAVKLDETGLEYIDIPVPTPVPSTIISMDFGSFANANAAMDAGTF